MNKNDELNTAKLDINLSDIDFKENKLDTFLQGAYDKTVAVSHNHSCTFHSMGRNVLEMYLEDKNNNIENGLGERIIKKLLKKHGNKLKNPIWAHAGKHPFGSFAYRKSFLESVKYYFSNATWGWLNLINPFFWISELIWGEYENDLYSVNKSTNHEIELHIDKNLSDNDKYRIGNILGQLIREEVANVMQTENKNSVNNNNFTENTINDFGGFTEINKGSNNKGNNEIENLKNEEKPKPETLYKNKMVQCLGGRYLPGKFDAPYVTQGSQDVIFEWQYLTSNDFLEEKQGNGPLETIVLEVNEKPISAKNAKLVFSGFDCSLYFDQNANDINNRLKEHKKKIDENEPPLICVIGQGYLIGRCQPIVGNQEKLKFINDLLAVFKETYGDRVYIESKISELSNDNNSGKNTNNINNNNMEINNLSK